MTPIRIVIVEDEPVTARNLNHLLHTIDNTIELKATLGSLGESLEWFNNNTGNYDLIFMDIRLADGISFDIFKGASINKPVIFVTAYNTYAIQAFKNNGLDYILKPFDEQELKQALNKYRSWMSNPPAKTTAPLSQLLEQIQSLTKTYKKSFLVHYRDRLIPVEAAKIAWFFTENEIVYARTADDQQYVIAFTMEQLEQQVNPKQFHRANRQFIVNKQAVVEVNFFFNGRLSVKTQPEPPERILISKARATIFKNWMDS
jgi:two-component system response regulator LytT